VATADAWGPTFVPLPHVNVKVSGRPSGSDEAEASNRAVVGATDPGGDVSASLAIGGWFTAAVTVLVARDVSPSALVAVTEAVNVPATAYVQLADGDVCGPTLGAPLPQSKTNERALPWGSVDEEASSATGSGTAPEMGVAVSAAAGGRAGADATIATGAVEARPAVSTTRTDAV
jgi:hypothetical protein